MSALLSIKHCYNQSRVEGAKSNGEERRLVRSEIDLKKCSFGRYTINRQTGTHTHTHARFPWELKMVIFAFYNCFRFHHTTKPHGKFVQALLVFLHPTRRSSSGSVVRGVGSGGYKWSRISRACCSVPMNFPNTSRLHQKTSCTHTRFDMH